MQTKKNLQNIIFILVIFTLLVSPMIYWFSLNGHWVKDSILEDRELAVFPQLSTRDFKTAMKRIHQGLYTEAGDLFFNQFIDTDFQRKVNKASAEQMLMRIPLVETSHAFERGIIQSAYLPLADKALPASFNSDIYVARDNSCLMQDPAFFTDADREAVDARIANYEELLTKFPNINFYVFNIETLPYSPYHPESPYFPQADAGRSLQYFLAHKPADLAFENFALTSFRDYQEKFFKTDQHWNIRASLKAYQQVYQMIKEKYPDISPMVTTKAIKQVEGLQFNGSMARKCLYPVTPDILEYATVGKMKYDTYVDGVATTYGNRDKYLSGKYDKADKFYNHYRGFYGKQEIEIHYHFDNGSQRNLLMITSSYSRTIQLYLASHFQDTYIVDLRFDEDRKSLKKFIDQYHITDVLVLGQPTVTYDSADDAIKP